MLETTNGSLPPERSAFQVPDGSPLYAENTWFGLAVPEANIQGTLYVWHRPHLNLSTGGIVLWNGKGEEVHDCLYSAWDWFMPFPKDGGVFDYTLSNGTSIQTIKDLHSFHLGSVGDGCDLDLTWDAIIDCQQFDLRGTALGPTARAHYQQVGRLLGSIEIDGETFDVSARTVRDHSWGDRAHDQLRLNIGYESAYASDSHGFTTCMVNSSPNRAPGGTATISSDKLVLGWYVRDGVLSKLVSATRFAEQGIDGRAQRVLIEGRDDLGRELHAEGRVESLLNWSGPLRWFWAGVRFEVDGHEAWGETQHGCTYTEEWRRTKRERWKPEFAH